MQRQPATSLDLFTDSVRLMGDATMVAVMEFDRRLDMLRMFSAAGKCADAYPILRSKLVRGQGPAYWELQEKEDSDEVFSVSFIEERDYRCHIPLAIDPYGKSQSKIRLLRSPDRDVVVINLAHAAADSCGLMTMASALLNAYLDPSSVPSCNEGLPVRDTQWTADLIDGLDVSYDPAGTTLSTWPALCARSQGPSSYHRVVIPPDQVSQVKQAAHECGGTINDALLSAFYLSLSELTGRKGPQRLSFPANLRQHLGDGSRIMSNQAANVAFSIAAAEGKRATLCAVAKETTRLKAGKIGVREQVAFDRFCDPEGLAVHRMVQEMARGQDQGMANIFLSNPGRFTLPPVEGLADAYLCYPGCLMPSTCFVISSFRGEMSVTIGFQDGDEQRDATRRALDGLVRHMPVDVSKVRFVPGLKTKGR